MLRSLAMVVVLVACSPGLGEPPSPPATPRSPAPDTTAAAAPEIATASTSATPPPSSEAPAALPAPAPLRPATDDFAVVPTTASIYRAAAALDPLRLDGQAGMLGTRTYATHYRFVGELRASDGERWVELETERLWDGKEHCTRAPWGLDDLALRVFVRRSELALVVSRELRDDRGDGTSIALSPGAVVTPSERSGYVRYASDHGVFELSAPAESLGTQYRPGKSEPYRSPLDLVLRRDAPADALELGDGTVIAAELARDLLDRKRVRGKRSLVRFESGCLELRALIADRWLQPPEESSIFGGVLGGTGSRSHVVRAGAPLTWRDGSPAGVTRTSAAFTDLVAREDGRVCLSRPRHGSGTVAHGLLGEDNEPSPTLVLCAAESDLEERP